MKKSIVVLSALFMLGACSAVPDNSFKQLVGGKTIKDVGVFSVDATAFMINGVEFWYVDGTENSGTYRKQMLSIKTKYVFTDVDINGGKYEVKVNDAVTIQATDFTFE